MDGGWQQEWRAMTRGEDNDDDKEEGLSTLDEERQAHTIACDNKNDRVGRRRRRWLSSVLGRR